MNTAASVIRTLIVDDEILARQNLEALLREDEGIEIVGQCPNGQAAVEAIRQHRPDLIFLDVQMPGMNGFEVLAETPAEVMPQVIFVTAYDQFALQAFEVRAIDYLLKPFNRTRFTEAVNRAKATLRQHDREELVRRLGDMMQALQRNPAAAPEAPGPRPLREEDERICLRCDGEIHMVVPADIVWVESDGDYVRLHSTDKPRYVRLPLQKLLERLDPRHFLRIHRSTIVNLRHLKKASPALYGEYNVELADGTKLRVSRTYVHELKSRL
jgi:two-component system, LytTR family, response regulator